MTEHVTEIVPPWNENGGETLLGWLGRMREETPYWQDGYGAHHVFRYADVHRILSDPDTFSSDFTRIMSKAQPLTKGELTSTDPPEHRTLRRVISGVFTPKMVTDLAPRIGRISHYLLDAVHDAEWDLVDRLSYPLSVTVIAELIGVPSSDQGLFRRWADQLREVRDNDSFAEDDYDEAQTTLAEIRSYMLQWARVRRENPGSDLISKLVTAEVDGESMDDDMIANFTRQLLLAGCIPAASLISNTIWTLDEHPAVWGELRRDRDLIPSVVEEVMRYRTPSPKTARVTTRAVELAERNIAANELVTVWLQAANRDPRVFPDPDRFDPRRQNGRQLAFGHGIHFCLGASLARLETRIALEAMLDRFYRIGVLPGVRSALYSREVFTPATLAVTTVPA